MLRTPLAAALGVIIGLLLLLIPLQRITSGGAAAAVPAPAPGVASEAETWLSLRLLMAATSASLSRPDGTILWSAAGPLPAGEHEAHIRLPASPSLELILELTFEQPGQETAAFLTLAPDGRDEITHHAIGRGRIRELMHFDWHAH